MALGSTIFTVSGVVCGLFSGWYWYLTSTIKITKDAPLHKGKPRYDLSDDVIVEGKNGEIPLLATALETSRLNRIAAFFTLASIICQALATALGNSH